MKWTSPVHYVTPIMLIPFRLNIEILRGKVLQLQGYHLKRVVREFYEEKRFQFSTLTLLLLSQIEYQLTLHNFYIPSVKLYIVSHFAQKRFRHYKLSFNLYTLFTWRQIISMVTSFNRKILFSC